MVHDENWETDTNSVDIVVEYVLLPARIDQEVFYAWVHKEDADGDPIVNTIKSGRSVSLKFEVFDKHNTEQTSTLLP